MAIAPAPAPTASHAPDPVSEYVPASPLRRLVISAVILFHLVAITVWNMPASYLQSILRSDIYSYMTLTGLAQGWGMFAPEPGHINFYMAARITYANGQQRVWEMGREDNRGMWARLVGERERKFVENIYDTPGGLPYYPQAAVWAAHKNDIYPTNPPVKVDLMRFWSTIPNPPDGVNQPAVSQWSSDVVYSTTVNTRAR